MIVPGKIGGADFEFNARFFAKMLLFADMQAKTNLKLEKQVPMGVYLPTSQVDAVSEAQDRSSHNSIMVVYELHCPGNIHEEFGHWNRST